MAENYYQRRRKSTPQTAKSILTSVLRTQGLEKRLQKFEFIWFWEEIVGKDIASRTAPEAIRGKSLIVRVESAAWAQELSFQKGAILHRLNRMAEQKKFSIEREVEDIRFYADRPKTRAPRYVKFRKTA